MSFTRRARKKYEHIYPRCNADAPLPQWNVWKTLKTLTLLNGSMHTGKESFKADQIFLHGLELE